VAATRRVLQQGADASLLARPPRPLRLWR